MSDYQPNSGYAPLSVVEAYWDALRAGREMPKRADIDPRGIESALEYAFILERVAPGVARMRIAGSHLHDVLGMEARGMPLTAFFEHEYRTEIAGLLEEVFQAPATAQVTMVSRPSLGQPALEARLVLLPLKSDLGDVSRILGCLVTKGDLGAAPRRFELRNTNMTRVGERAAEVQSPLPAPVPAPQAKHFADPAAPFTPKSANTTPKAKRPFLRLVKSDD